jgi:hypothetical protein
MPQAILYTESSTLEVRAQILRRHLAWGDVQRRFGQ